MPCYSPAAEQSNSELSKDDHGKPPRFQTLEHTDGFPDIEHLQIKKPSNIS